MVVKFEVQARKKPKLNAYMDVWDFQMILLTVLIIPFVIWYTTGVSIKYTWVFGVGYIMWMYKFKIDKPLGYWTHWLSFKFRGKAWTMGNGQLPNENYQDIKTT